MISDDVDITKVGSNIDDEASVNTNNIPKTRYINNSSDAFRYLVVRVFSYTILTCYKRSEE